MLRSLGGLRRLRLCLAGSEKGRQTMYAFCVLFGLVVAALLQARERAAKF